MRGGHFQEKVCQIRAGRSEYSLEAGADGVRKGIYGFDGTEEADRMTAALEDRRMAGSGARHPVFRIFRKMHRPTGT